MIIIDEMAAIPESVFNKIGEAIRDRKKMYAVHPGFINSKNDRQCHYITFEQLCKLYKLSPADCYRWNDEEAGNYRNRDKYIHLYPDYHGEYKLPE